MTRTFLRPALVVLACAGVIAPRIKRSLIRWLVLAMTLKLCTDA